MHLEAGLMPSVLDMSIESLSSMLMIHFGDSCISQENAIYYRDTGSALKVQAEPEHKRDKK